jgi:hypothetical protein
MKKIVFVLATAVLAMPALAKLPAPGEEAKAKAAEAAAKTAHAGKVDNYKLCQSMDKVAAHYFKSAAAAKKEVKPAVATPACADPGPYVPAVAAAPVAAPAPTPGAAAAAPAAAAPAPAAAPAAAKDGAKKS